MKEITPLDAIKTRIHTIRGKQVILDRDLAELYEVETRVLNQAVKRNIERFPDDFMFRLTNKELQNLRLILNDNWISQDVIPNSTRMGLRICPYVFTEHGIAALSGVLKSKKAVEVNIQIMRAFISMRRFLSQNAEVFQRLDRVELKQIEQDKRIDTVFKALETEKPKHDTSRLVSSLRAYSLTKEFSIMDKYLTYCFKN
jgi:hypothetical protein